MDPWHDRRSYLEHEGAIRFLIDFENLEGDVYSLRSPWPLIPNLTNITEVLNIIDGSLTGVLTVSSF